MSNRPLAVDVVLHVDPAWPAFEGHFPGAPVLPGAALLARVIDAIEQRPELNDRLGRGPVHVQQVKFLAPVRPDDTLRVELIGDDTGIAFTVQRGPTPIARGRITADTASAWPVRDPGGAQR